MGIIDSSCQVIIIHRDVWEKTQYTNEAQASHVHGVGQWTGKHDYGYDS